jgi:metal-sulfur cluster biosynthetic enzyme
MIADQVDEELVWTSLRQVVDPELGCNIVDLGLIYSVGVSTTKVAVKMTLTTRGCPMHESISAGVQSAVLALPGVEQATVDVVWDPPWNPSMMSEQGRALLGIYDC